MLPPPPSWAPSLSAAAAAAIVPVGRAAPVLRFGEKRMVRQIAVDTSRLNEACDVTDGSSSVSTECAAGWRRAWLDFDERGTSYLFLFNTLSKNIYAGFRAYHRITEKDFMKL